jgi:hypothetical protein
LKKGIAKMQHIFGQTAISKKYNAKIHPIFGLRACSGK